MHGIPTLFSWVASVMLRRGSESRWCGLRERCAGDAAAPVVWRWGISWSEVEVEAF
jgi:hypothetical protein